MTRPTKTECAPGAGALPPASPAMKALPALLAALAATCSLAGCTGLMREAPPPGAPLAEVVAKLGQPTEIYREPNGGEDLEYRGQPMGQFQWMARIGPDGRLIVYEQVLTSESFARVKVDHTTKDEILRLFGRPAEISRVHFHNYEVWSYRYKEAGVWNSMMSVHFDDQGIVRQMLNGPDPLYDDRFRRL